MLRGILTESWGVCFVMFSCFRGRGLSSRSGTMYGYECAGDFRGTGSTAADFEFLLRAAGAGIVASGLWGLGSRHGDGGGVLVFFDSVVRVVVGRRKD